MQSSNPPPQLQSPPAPVDAQARPEPTATPTPPVRPRKRPGRPRRAKPPARRTVAPATAVAPAITKQVRHAEDAGRLIVLHMPKNVQTHYTPIAPLRHVLVLALDALCNPRAPSDYVHVTSRTGELTAHQTLRHLVADTPKISREDAETLTRYAELWLGGYRDRRAALKSEHYPNLQDAWGRTRVEKPGRSHAECLRYYLGARHSTRRKGVPAHMWELDARVFGQRDHFLYRTFKEAVYRNDLRQWHFKTSWGNPSYAAAKYLHVHGLDMLSQANREQVERDMFQVDADMRKVEMSIAEQQTRYANAHNRELPHRKKILTPPANGMWTKVNTSLPEHETNQLRERAYRTTSDTLSRFCTYVWLWAHSQDFKVPHVIAAKLHAFASGEEWETTLQRYRDSEAFRDAPHAHVNPLNGDLFPPTPGLLAPGTGYWLDTRGNLDLSKRTKLSKHTQIGIAAYVTSKISK